MDDKLVRGRIDVGNAAMIDRKVQAVRRDGAAEPLMRRARMRGAEFAVGIGQRPRYVFLKWRRRLYRRQGVPDRQTPGRIGERSAAAPVAAPATAKPPAMVMPPPSKARRLIRPFPATKSSPCTPCRRLLWLMLSSSVSGAAALALDSTGGAVRRPAAISCCKRRTQSSTCGLNEVSSERWPRLQCNLDRRDGIARMRLAGLSATSNQHRIIMVPGSVSA
jgi:hypothetical protein